MAGLIGPTEAQGAGEPTNDEKSIVAETKERVGHLISGPGRWVGDKRQETDRSEFRRDPREFGDRRLDPRAAR